MNTRTLLHSALLIKLRTSPLELTGLVAGGNKWAGAAYAPTTGLIYCAPVTATSVLMINPLTNATDTTTLGGVGLSHYKWYGIAFAPTSGMLYCAPHTATSVLIINPLTNTTDITTLGALGWAVESSGRALRLHQQLASCTALPVCAASHQCRLGVDH